MAWTFDTYAGLRGTGQPSNWRIAMFELCRAVNEREDAMGVASATQFYKANGTQGRHLSMDDLLGMRIAGEGNYFTINCERIMAWIKEYCDWFTVASGPSATWTLATLESDVGAFAFWDTPLGATHALFFQQCQDALDRLTHVFMARPFGISGVTKRVRESTLVDTSMEDVWDSAIGDATPSSSSLIFSPNLGISIKRVNPSGSDPAEYFNARIEDDCEDIVANLSPMSGTITYAGFSYTLTSALDGGGSIDVSFGGTSFSGSLGADDSSTTGVAGSLGDFTIGSVNLLRMDIAVPGDCPLDGLPSSEGRIYNGGISCAISTNFSIYFDIASELTDQA